MQEIGLDHALAFLKMLDANAETHHWQVYHDPKKTSGFVDQYCKPVNFSASFHDCLDFFKAVQQLNYGVHVLINQTDGVGKLESNITKYRCAFVDLDNKALVRSPTEPTMVTSRDSLHHHIFYKLSDVTTADQFRRVQKRLALYYDSDQQVVDPGRGVRLPGTLNLKDPNKPGMYLIQSQHHSVYSFEQIEQIFTLDDYNSEVLENWCNSRGSLREGGGFNETPLYRQRFIDWLNIAEPAVLGSGSHTLLRVASMGYDLGIPLVECQKLMWDHYDPRCTPSWNDTGEQDHFNNTIKNAYQYANNTPGCRTAAGLFSNEDPVQEPDEGWELNCKRREFKQSKPVIEWSQPDSSDITQEQAAFLMTQVNSKTSAWDLARTFVSVEFNVGNLIRHDKIFYEYKSVVWCEISDDAVRSKIAWFYSSLLLPPSKISAILTTVEDYVYSQDLKNASWLKDCVCEGVTMVTKNCIVNIDGDDVNSLPHTSNYFTLNDLKYDYNPGEDCPDWISFLKTLWADQSEIDALQEAFGYSLINDSTHHKIFLLIGKSRAGKSVISTILSKLVGEHNTTSPSIESITENSIMSAISNKSLVLIPEATDIHPSRQNAVLGRLKSLSGGDRMSYHRLYKGEANFTYGGTIWMTTNAMPHFVDTSGALANRFRPFIFTKSFAGHEDTTLPLRLANEIPGIFNWAMEGLRRLKRNGDFTQSETAVETIDDMKRDMFPLADFVDDYCVLTNNVQTSTQDLYNSYKHWCKMKDMNHMSLQKFGKYLKSCYLPITPVRFKDVPRTRGYNGISINKDVMNINTGNIHQFPAIVTQQTHTDVLSTK